MFEYKPQDPTTYHSYLLRLWRDGPQSPWRASLQSTTTGECHIFADIASLLAFLQDQTGNAWRQEN